MTEASRPEVPDRPEAMDRGFKVVCEGLSAWYGSKQAVTSVSLSIRARAVTALIGPSGCGKSTFLRCLIRRRFDVIIATMRRSGSVGASSPCTTRAGRCCGDGQPG